MQQISLGRFIEWETTVYFSPFFYILRPCWPPITNSALSYPLVCLYCRPISLTFLCAIPSCSFLLYLSDRWDFSFSVPPFGFLSHCPSVSFSRFVDSVSCIQDTGKSTKLWNDLKFSWRFIFRSLGPITRLWDKKIETLRKDVPLHWFMFSFVFHLARYLLGSPKARNLWKDERAKEVEAARKRGIMRTWKVGFMGHL